MNFRLILILLGLCCFLSSKAQNKELDSLMASKLLKEDSPFEDIRQDAYEKAAILYKKHELWNGYFRASIKALSNNRAKNDMKLFSAKELLVEEIMKHKEVDQPLVIMAKKILADAYSSMGNPQKAAELLTEIQSGYSLDDPKLLESKINIYRSLAKNYFRLGDGDRLVSHVIEAEKLAQQLGNKKLLADCLYEKGVFFGYTRQKGAIGYINKAIQLAESIYSKNHHIVLSYYKGKANIYYIQGIKDKSVYEMEKLLPKMLSIYGEKDKSLINFYLNIAAYYKDWRHNDTNLAEGAFEKEKIRRHQEAIRYNKKAVEVFEKNGIRKGVDLAILYRNMGIIARYLNSEEEGQVYFHKSLVALLEDGVDEDPYAFIPITEQKIKCYDLEQAYTTIRFKIIFLRRLYDKDPTLKALALKWIKEAAAILSVYQSRLSDDAMSSAFTLIESYGIFAMEEYSMHYKENTGAIDVDDLLNLFEKNRNFNLLNTVRSSKESQMGGISKTLLEEEKAIKKQIEETQKKLLDAKSSQNEELVDGLQKQQLEEMTEYEQFVKKVEKEAPKYHQLKYQEKHVDVKTIQADLDKETILLEYYYNKKGIYTLIIGKDKVKFYARDKSWNEVDPKTGKKIKIRRDVDEVVKALRNSFTSIAVLKENPSKAYKDYVENAYAMYSFVLGLDSMLMDFEAKKIIIVPALALNFIPFEALICSPADTTKQDYKGLDYLLNHYAISYAYSATLWHENLQTKKQKRSKSGILGFAASYGNLDSLSDLSRSPQTRNLRKGLDDLPGARAELEGLAKIYGGHFYFGKDANETNFLKSKFEKYNILHLAMHGLLNKQNPFASSLAFTENGDSTNDNFVHAYELTTLEIPMDLVVLSACETGYGKYENGEGVASLGRSFMYAGVPSLVLSLWQVNDASTSVIMQAFYKNLAAGKDKATALQLAKLTYLKGASDLGAHPLFWAPFVVLGDSRPITVATKGPSLLLWGAVGVGAIGVLAFAVFWMRKKRGNA